MNTKETLTNAQLFLSTKLITRLEKTSPNEFSHVDVEDLLCGVMYELNDLSPSNEQDIYYLRERINDQFEQADCIIKLVVSVLNALSLLLMYSQAPESSATIFDITNKITQRLIKATDYI